MLLATRDKEFRDRLPAVEHDGEKNSPILPLLPGDTIEVIIEHVRRLGGMAHLIFRLPDESGYEVLHATLDTAPYVPPVRASRLRDLPLPDQGMAEDLEAVRDSE